MAITTRSQFTFNPQIAQRHVSAYFRRLLTIGRLATNPPDNNFYWQRGGQITFPYYDKIGAAVAGVENQDVDIDSLGDNSFTALISEVVKGVGTNDTATYHMGPTLPGWLAEAQSQIARVFAEKVEDDCWAELIKPASHDDLITQSGDITLTTNFGADKGAESTELRSQLCNIRALGTALNESFGDRRDECIAMIMHSSHYNDLETDPTAGFLKADANGQWNNDPLYKIKGFRGRMDMFFGLPLFVNDGVPVGPDITITDGARATQKYKTYNMVLLKKNAFGLIFKQDPRIEFARDIGKRQLKMVGTQWYATRGFHKAYSTDDVRVTFRRFSTRIQTTG